jgi:hypothetical protein
MQGLTIALRGAAAAAALLVALGISSAGAQEHRYATGGAPTPAAEKAGIAHAPVYRDFLPPAVDLSRYMPAVGDQGQQGSCVGWATAYAARAYYAEQIEHRDISQTQNIPSPAWLFDIIHIGGDCDQGAYIPDAMNVLRKGALSLADFPYDDSKCPRPLPPARSKATDFRIDSFEQVWDQQTDTDLDKVKGALAQGNPVVILASLDNAFFDLNPRQSIWTSDASQKDEGGHAITLVGYDDTKQIFKFINQWSTAWGDKGYGRMTYDTFKARVYEGYVMHLPGDPEIALTEADFTPDAVVDTPPPNSNVFVPPLDVRPTAATRDVADTSTAVTLPSLSCGRVDLGHDADGNTIATGFVGTQKELDAVDDALKGRVDDIEVALAPWPSCELQLTLAAQLADSDTPQAVIDPESPKVGDSVNIGIESPGFASYLYAAYFSADGTVATLSQPTSLDLKAKAPHTQLKFGDRQPNSISLNVQPPVGDEMLLVVASEKPLFDQALPDSETNRAFLSDLRAAVLSGDAGRVTATVLPVTTTD